MQLTVKDAAKALNVTEKTVYRWIQSGGLPAYRVAGTYRINRAMLFEWATSKRVNFPAEDPEADPEPMDMPALGRTLQDGGIHYRVGGTSKTDVLAAVVDLLKLPDSADRAGFLQALLAREQLQSTGVGDGIALPHVRNPAMVDVASPSVCLCFLETPIDYGALDGKKVRALFVPLSPNVRIHLHLLSRIAFALRHPQFKRLIEEEGCREDILAAAQSLEPASA
ncbi:MAG: PTS transporter subunit EIIA [Lentisphaerae bacterium]|nr:PTS transporter subunit EIIA [Lentisphaerota bacterium]